MTGQSKWVYNKRCDPHFCVCRCLRTHQVTEYVSSCQRAQKSRWRWSKRCCVAMHKEHGIHSNTALIADTLMKQSTCWILRDVTSHSEVGPVTLNHFTYSVTKMNLWTIEMWATWCWTHRPPPSKLSNDGGSDSVRSRIAKLRLLWRGIIRECAHECVTQHYKCTNGASEIKHCLCSCCLHPVSGRRGVPILFLFFFETVQERRKWKEQNPGFLWFLV